MSLDLHTLPNLWRADSLSGGQGQHALPALAPIDCLRDRTIFFFGQRYSDENFLCDLRDRTATPLKLPTKGWRIGRRNPLIVASGSEIYNVDKPRGR
jgi:hypothetical protein